MMIVNVIRNNKLLTTVLLIYIILGVMIPTKAIESINNSIYYVKEMLIIMPVIFFITTIIETWVPKEMIIKGLGEKSGIKGYTLSIIFGSISVGPIYAAFPVCKTLIKKGASIKNIVIILSAWAVIKVPMLATEARFLSARFMAIRWIFTVIAIMIISYIVSVFVDKNNIPVISDKCEEQEIEIKEQFCIGCGLCANSLPEFFAMKNKKAFIKQQVKDTSIEKLNIILEKCPGKAIIRNI